MTQVSKLALVIMISVVAATVGADAAQDGDSAFDGAVEAYNRGDYADAGRGFDAARNHYIEAGESYRESLMYSLLWSGASNYYLGDMFAAVERYSAAREISEELGALEAQKNILVALANTYYSLEDFQRTEDTYRDVLGIVEGQYPTELPGILQFLGYINVLLEDYHDALGFYIRSLDAVEASATPYERSGIHGMLGYSHFGLRAYAKAQREYRTALDLIDQYGPIEETVQYLGWLGLIHFQQAEYQQAIHLYVQAYTMAQEIGNLIEQARMLAQLGFASDSLGDPDAAVEYYSQALDLSRKTDQVDFVIASLESLGNLYGKLERKAAAHDAYVELASLTTGEQEADAYNLAGFYSYALGNYRVAAEEFSASLEGYRVLNLQSEVLTVLYNLGAAAIETGDAETAISSLAEAARLGARLRTPGEALDAANALAEVLSDAGRRRDQIELYTQLVPVLQNEEMFVEQAIVLNNIGVLLYESADYHRAIDHYRRALEISERLGDSHEVSAHLHNLAQSLAALGRYDEALDGYQRALDISIQAENLQDQADLLNSIGEVYRSWRWFSKSLEYYDQAMDIYDAVGPRDAQASVYNNIGMAYRGMGEVEQAERNFSEAYAIFVDTGVRDGEAVALSNLGEIHRDRGEYDLAMAKYRDALSIDLEIDNPRGVAIRRNNIGLLQLIEGNYQAAEEQLLGVLELVETIGQPAETARILNNLGEVYFYQADFDQAATSFSRAIEIKERLRRTASGAVRREYLSSEIDTYNNLAVAYFHLGALSKSFETIELASSKYLREQMGDNASEIDIKGIDYYRDHIDAGTMVISITQTDLVYLQVIAFDTQNTYSHLTGDIEAQVHEIYDTYGRTMTRRISDPEIRSIDGVLEFYRYLLSKPLLSRKEHSALADIGSMVYEMLLLPIEFALEDKDELVIIPSGQFSFVPFETLRLGDGSYLVEKYHVRYANSMAVADIIRNRRYPENRRSLLAFGGAIYDERSYKEDLARGKELLTKLTDRAMAELDARNDVRAAYDVLGYGSWQNLPGTYAEVQAIAAIVPGSTALTGALVSEAQVKRLSQMGDLATYRVLHIAAHGMVVPEVPELSAVVLSQFAQEQREDGYLTVREISGLDLRADFVNLSACETGLGKLYAGEGVVGLAQAFLIAGANGLSVSLWQVSDESTTELMTGVYRAAEDQGLSYDEALTKMKRAFIRREDYAHPFYWAPFVYYGN